MSDVEVQGVGRIELDIWDTGGQEVYDSLRPLSYPDSHALILCFSIGDPLSYRNVLEKVRLIDGLAKPVLCFCH